MARVLVLLRVVQQRPGEQGATEAEAEAHDARVQLRVVRENPRLWVLRIDVAPVVLGLLLLVVAFLACVRKVQGDTSGCSLGFVEIKIQVAF